MTFSNLDLSIKDYIGLVRDGVSTVVTIKYNNNIYESIYWYDDVNSLFTIDDSLETLIGHISTHENYNDIMLYLKDSVPPYSELKGKLPVIN